MYKIIIEKQNDLQRIKLLNAKTEEYISILPDLGANVNEIVLKKDDKLFSVLDGRKSKKEFEGSEIYNSAVLFPFANRIRHGKYEFEGKAYQLPINWPQEGHAIHGFICNKQFEIEGKHSDEKKAEIELVHKYDGFYPGYPFPFQLSIKYRLDEKGFSANIEAYNTGVKRMPFNLGWHPYFSINENINRVKMQIPLSNIVLVDKLIPTGEKKPNTQFLELEEIYEKEFDTCFSINKTADFFNTKLFLPQKEITIILEQDKAFKYLQIYTPPERKSIAIEPMTGNVNNFNNKSDLITLDPEERINMNYGIRIE